MKAEWKYDFEQSKSWSELTVRLKAYLLNISLGLFGDDEELSERVAIEENYRRNQLK